MGYRPTQPDGDSSFLDWAKKTHDAAQKERRVFLCGGFMGVQTGNGVSPRIKGGDEGFSLPPGIEVRELSVCQLQSDGSTRQLFVRVLSSVLYDKNDDGDPVDSDGNVLDETTDPPLPDVTDSEDASGFEIDEG
jgi:hypothetical protein